MSLFVQTISGRASKPEDLQRHVLAWCQELSPNAVGWLGSTGGISHNGDFVLMMRFISQEGAWITNDLPASATWWSTCRPLLQNPIQITESTGVNGLLQGGSDDAVHVRITRGEAAYGLLRNSLRKFESIAAAQPVGLIGGFVAWHQHNRFTQALYLSSAPGKIFQSEANAVSIESIIHDQESAVRHAQVIHLENPWLMSPIRSSLENTQ